MVWRSLTALREHDVIKWNALWGCTRPQQDSELAGLKCIVFKIKVWGVSMLSFANKRLKARRAEAAGNVLQVFDRNPKNWPEWKMLKQRRPHQWSLVWSCCQFKPHHPCLRLSTLLWTDIHVMWTWHEIFCLNISVPVVFRDVKGQQFIVTTGLWEETSVE